LLFVLSDRVFDHIDIHISTIGLGVDCCRDNAVNGFEVVDKKTFDNFIQLSFFLEELFDRSVDLMTIESLSPYIGLRILDEVEYSMSPSAREYLLHLLDETTYMVTSSNGLEKATFFKDETLKRAYVRSLKVKRSSESKIRL
jgi:hypothetical protein